jgi:hypothetical protein
MGWRALPISTALTHYRIFIHPPNSVPSIRLLKKSPSFSRFKWKFARKSGCWLLAVSYWFLANSQKPTANSIL